MLENTLTNKSKRTAVKKLIRREAKEEGKRRKSVKAKGMEGGDEPGRGESASNNLYEYRYFNEYTVSGIQCVGSDGKGGTCAPRRDSTPSEAHHNQPRLCPRTHRPHNRQNRDQKNRSTSDTDLREH